MSTPAVQLRGVSRAFGPYLAVSDIDLTVHAGERVAIVGPSGAGKTTLLSLMNGSLAPTSGSVEVFGQQLSALAKRARRALQRRIGAVTQDLALVDQLRVLHNINAGRLGAMSTADALSSLLWPRSLGPVRDALDHVDLAWALHERTDKLSGGERQRVAIARTLVQQADLILADEPVSKLDPVRAIRVLELLADRAPTVVMSLHQPQFAMSHATRVVGIAAGRVRFDVPAADLSTDDLASVYAT
jgi:phosphonate transport system ATP-binding protein